MISEEWESASRIWEELVRVDRGGIVRTSRRKGKKGRNANGALSSPPSLFVEQQLNLTRKSQTLEFRIDDSGDTSSDCGDLELLTFATDTL